VLIARHWLRYKAPSAPISFFSRFNDVTVVLVARH